MPDPTDPDPRGELPGPASGRDYLAGQLEQAREAMRLALSVLRGDAYRRLHGVASPAELDTSQARGEAIDALGLALGHTQLIGGTPIRDGGTPIDEVAEQRRSPRVSPARLEAIEGTLADHTARFAVLEQHLTNLGVPLPTGEVEL